MTWYLRILCLIPAAALVVGCANGGRAPATQPTAAALPDTSEVPPSTSAATAPDRADLALHQITPVPQLPTSRPVREGLPPLQAIELFARARGEMHENRHFAAVGLLERAILLDAESYELYYALGQAHLGGTTSTDPAIEAFERAAELRPGSLDVRLQLARLYLAKENHPRAMNHLRLARKSEEYADSDGESAVVDLLLGRILQHEGYDRAALQCYERVLARIRNPSPSVRQEHELAVLINVPQALYLQISELASRRGKHARAVAALRAAIDAAPHDIDIRARLLDRLVQNGQTDEMRRAALELLQQFHASEPAMKILRARYAAADLPEQLIEDLEDYRAAHPDDRSIFLALVDELHAQGRVDQAQALLIEAARRDPADSDVITRLVTSLDRQGDTQAAARWLIESAARDPDTIRATSGLWAGLLQISRHNRIRLNDLQRLEVSPAAEAARLFWVSRLAQMWNRDSLARESIQSSVERDEVFAPSYRSLMGDIWRRPELDDAQKSAATEELIARARTKGHPALATELRGLLRLHQGETDAALAELASAVAQPDSSPELRLTYADALLLDGDITRAEQTLWKLVSDHPGFDDAYEKLFSLYVSRRNGNQAIRVLQIWLQADPSSIDARLLQAIVLLQSRQFDAAERQLLQLFDEAGDNEQVLGALQALFAQRGQPQRWIELLEQEWEKHPDNHQVVARLSAAYVQGDRQNDAIRVLDAARQAARGEPDVLYFLAHLYGLADRKDLTLEVLEQVIEIDPTHAAASNDLGYTWADEGHRLDEAEALIRVAVAAEPDNHAFLDSLGWILYKRSKFDEARDFLERAIGEAVRPDPVVVDHLGDALYQLGHRDEAKAQWQRTIELLEEAGPASADLREDVQRKLDEFDGETPVRVAPVVEDAHAGDPAPPNTVVRDGPGDRPESRNTPELNK